MSGPFNVEIINLFHLRKLRLRESELESRSICYQVNDILKKAGKHKLLRKHCLFLEIFFRQRTVLFVLGSELCSLLIKYFERCWADPGTG